MPHFTRETGMPFWKFLVSLITELGTDSEESSRTTLLEFNKRLQGRQTVNINISLQKEMREKRENHNIC